MRVLIVKTSSLGDVIHTLPALTDAGNAIPGICFDWIVEENFVEIPKWHSLVVNVIPIAWRRWRKNIFSARTFKEWRAFRETLNKTHYDVIIDAQGLLKSAFFTLFARGKRSGLDRHSAREFLAALFYQSRYAVTKNQHAILRTRSLMSQVLNYSLPTTVPDYGIDRKKFIRQSVPKKYLVFLHGTTWKTKHWPENYWLQLAKLANMQGFAVKLPWGNDIEKERALRIAAECEDVTILPKLNLAGIAEVLAAAEAIISVDTGLGHLAAALDVPTLSLYGPTNPLLTGTLGKSQIHLSAKFSCAPCLSRECSYREPSSFYPACFSFMTPENVWNTFLQEFQI